MALLEMTSNLSRLGSTTVTTDTQTDRGTPRPNTSKFSHINKNFGSNTLTAGYTDSFPFDSLNESSFPRTLYLDSKGDFSSMFSATNKAVPNTYNLDTNPTPLQQISMIGINGTTNFATNPNQYGFSFTPQNQSDNKYPTITPTTSLESRLYRLHDTGREINGGFTRSGLSLDNYYAQQPGNLRDIGQRWGDGGINIPFISDTAEALLDGTAAVLGTFGSSVFGRDISTYVDTYKADISRIGKFATDPVYLLKQGTLHKRNRYDGVYSQKMGLGNADTSLGDMTTQVGELLSLAGNSGLLDINPQVYNPLSIFSTPGVSGMMFNRNGRNFGDLSTLVSTIVDTISETALKWVTSKGGIRTITGAVGGFLQQAGGFVGGLIGKSKLGQGISSYASTSKTLKAIGESKFPKLDVKGIVEQGKKIQDLAKTITQEAGAIGKAQLSKLDPKAFQDVSVDKVNLITYGKQTEAELIDSEALDWIPFRFTDARSGAHIIFRASLSGITDTFSPEYTSERYVGRPDSVYVYQGTSREISFNFDVYPKSGEELVTLWEKLNYLAGLTYPSWDSTGTGMIAPFSKLTIGDMYHDTPGYISALSYTVQDNGTWEVDFAKLPKYIQVACTFVYIGNRKPTSTQKHFEADFITDEIDKVNDARGLIIKGLADARTAKAVVGASTAAGKKFMSAIGL